MDHEGDHLALLVSPDLQCELQEAVGVGGLELGAGLEPGRWIQHRAFLPPAGADYRSDHESDVSVIPWLQRLTRSSAGGQDAAHSAIYRCVDLQVASLHVGGMEGDLQRRLGQHLRSYRQARELSQEAFADVLGVHRTYMGGIERGERNLTLKSLERIADRLGVDPLELLRVGDF